jgi:hypothetical protein
MNSEFLFSMTLGLQEPWKIKEIEFTSSKRSGLKELHLHIGFTADSRFPDKTDALCNVHDTIPCKWRHLNFFEHS